MTPNINQNDLGELNLAPKDIGKNYKEAIKNLREEARMQEEFGIDFTLAPEKENEKSDVEV